VSAFRSDELTEEEELRWLWRAQADAADLWDDESWVVLSTRHLELARAAGALTALAPTLHSRAVAHVLAGELGAAALLVAELNAVQQATGMTLGPYAALTLAAWRGHVQDVGELIDSTLDALVARGEGIAVMLVQLARAVLANGLGHHEDAAVAAQEAAAHPHDPAPANWALSELVEAAAKSGQRELAAEALARLEVVTRAAGTDWALGIRARAHALVSDDEASYREAIERLEHTRIRGELARTRLLYGEWLRGQAGRADDARAQLRIAFDLLTRVEAGAFAERARRELLAAGEAVAGRAPETRGALTPQEAHIARLAADGHTNPEIGAQLFLSPRTIEYHLRKVFGKLEISSRRELADALG
jgi:DNA-binding CsgD family transcriptional regulator